MRYYKDGHNIIATIGVLDMPEITSEEYAEAMEEAKKRRAEQAAAYEAMIEPTTEERIAELEEALALLLSGEVE